MERTTVDGVALDYEVRGDGEPVMLIHAGVCADFFAPLMDQPGLRGYRLIRYHRAGYAGSERVAGPVSIGRNAEHCRLVMRQLGVSRAHIVGHSSSAAMALQLALDHPEAVRSLALLETALLVVPSGPFAGLALQSYRAGDRAAAVDIWLRGVAGPDYRAVLDQVLPEAFDRAVNEDADTFFGQELPALREWSFGPAEANRIAQPVLAVLGGRSGEVASTFEQRHELLLAWLPTVEPYVLAGATHLLQLQNPSGMADGLARFFARHAPAAS